ncbi:MAG: hypothetical protein H6Q92_744 [Nitrospirae bacterium]|nr:hypothetical protein [Nitrospirota bacterium]
MKCVVYLPHNFHQNLGDPMITGSKSLILSLCNLSLSTCIFSKGVVQLPYSVPVYATVGRTAVIVRSSQARRTAAMLSLPAISATARFSVSLISRIAEGGSIHSGKLLIKSGLLTSISRSFSSILFHNFKGL